MLNQYPLWKYLLLIVVLVFSAIYALPNLYGEDPALQVTASRGVEVDITTQEKVRALLKQANIPYDSIALANGQLLLRFPDTESQLAAKDAVKQGLGRN